MPTARAAAAASEVASGTPGITAATAPKATPYREPLGDVVQRYGGDEQDAALPVGFYALGLPHRAPGVKMRQYPVEAPQEDPPAQEPDHRRYPRRASASLRELDGRRQEREVARRDHNTGGESEHGVQDVTLDLVRKEDQPRPQSRHPPGEPRGEQYLYNRRQPRNRVYHLKLSVFDTSELTPTPLLEYRSNSTFN